MKFSDFINEAKKFTWKSIQVRNLTLKKENEGNDFEDYDSEILNELYDKLSKNYKIELEVDVEVENSIPGKLFRKEEWDVEDIEVVICRYWFDYKKERVSIGVSYAMDDKHKDNEIYKKLRDNHAMSSFSFKGDGNFSDRGHWVTLFLDKDLIKKLLENENKFIKYNKSGYTLHGNIGDIFENKIKTKETRIKLTKK